MMIQFEASEILRKDVAVVVVFVVAAVFSPWLKLIGVMFLALPDKTTRAVEEAFPVWLSSWLAMFNQIIMTVVVTSSSPERAHRDCLSGRTAASTAATSQQKEDKIR